jgi:2-methylcitrate dehydratase PrpD
MAAPYRLRFRAIALTLRAGLHPQPLRGRTLGLVVSLCDDSRAMSETKVLSSYVVTANAGDIPDDVRHEARRAILNYVGCAIGGSRHAAMEIAIRALGPFSGNPTARVLARTDRLDPLHASLMNGISSHVFDYDDTTPQNYMHPTSPLASALFAYSSVNPVRGSDFMHAFILGFEVESRIGNAVYPAHYDAGWHITGTAGVFAAAASVGRLLGLTTQQMIWALGLAATQAAGLREMFGSMAKAFHPGRAAQNGYSAALLAQAGFTAGEHSLEGPRGFAAVQAAQYDLSKITEALGTDYNLRRNTYKPFPCGIVNHPTIDGCIQLHNEQLDPEKIASVSLRVAPLVMDLCGKKAITKGLEGKFSVVHGAAIGLVRGKAGIQEYTDEAVNDPTIRRVRESVTATGDISITDDQAHIEVTLTDGRKVTRFVEKSLGNIHRPMSDGQLEAKFRDQAAPILPSAQIEKTIDFCWKIDTLDNVSSLVEATVPA